MFRKIISVTDGKKVKPFNMTTILPMAPTTIDRDIKHDMSQVER